MWAVGSSRKTANSVWDFYGFVKLFSDMRSCFGICFRASLSAKANVGATPVELFCEQHAFMSCVANSDASVSTIPAYSELRAIVTRRDF